MRIGIISDTHGHVQNTRAGVRMLESLQVETVLHCGDIGSPEIVELLAPWPTHFVFGNCDSDEARLRRAIEAAGQTCHGLFGDLTFQGVRIALLHSHERRRLPTTIASGEWQVVCYGHTHVAAIDRTDDVLVINPGAIYRANPHSLAILEVPQLTATIVSL